MSCGDNREQTEGTLQLRTEPCSKPTGPWSVPPHKDSSAGFQFLIGKTEFTYAYFILNEIKSRSMLLQSVNLIKYFLDNI